ncbi:MAG: hypothetical protein KBC27_00370 [Rickettsiales bacterium]|nr:hypothetical protein [Rickettsiales bacterium]
MVCPACPVVGTMAVVAAAGGVSLSLALGIKVTSGIVGLGSVGYGVYSYMHRYAYLPQHNNSLDKVSEKLKSAEHMCIEGSGANNFLEGSGTQNNHFYGKNGADIFQARNGSNDYFYFSLCTTQGQKIRGNVSDGWKYFVTTYKVVPTIYNFRDDEDVIRIFCSKRPVEESQVHVAYDTVQDFTLIKVDIPVRVLGYLIPGAYVEEAIVVQGKHDGLLGEDHNQLELNVPFTSFC